MKTSVNQSNLTVKYQKKVRFWIIKLLITCFNIAEIQVPNFCLLIEKLSPGFTVW